VTLTHFHEWIPGIAIIALLTGCAAPASAQAFPFQCVANAGVPPIVRGEGFAEPVGDLTLNCTGGVPTAAGTVVPQADVVVFLNTIVTSRLLTAASPAFTEALLIIDEPSSPVNPTRPMLNCGAPGASDNGPSGPGVCSIISDGNPADTYNGSTGSTGYGTGHPNVFQGRQMIGSTGVIRNAIAFLGVPLDPPGPLTSLTLRITNVRADAELIGVSTTFVSLTIQMSVSIAGPTAPAINNPEQIVAYTQHGIITSVARSRTDFVHHNSENPDLYRGTVAAPGYRGLEGFNMAGGYNPANNGVCNVGSTSAACNTLDATPTFRFLEGFANSWKGKNLHEFITNGTFGSSVTGGSYQYNGGLSGSDTLIDDVQNVNGAIYNTESGFENNTTDLVPNPNPPAGFGFAIAVTAANHAFSNAATGIANAGIADHGTRLALNFSRVPVGAAIFVPTVIYLYHQGDAAGLLNGDPTIYNPGHSTGVMVLTGTNANGAGHYNPVAGTNLHQVTNGLAVYEILYADPFGLEAADVPVVVSYDSALLSNVNQTVQVSGGLAPFYFWFTGRPASHFGAAPDAPRFIRPANPFVLFSIAPN
jgi:hypothetical protein